MGKAMRRVVLLGLSSIFLYNCGNAKTSNFSEAGLVENDGRRGEILFLGHDSDHHNSYRYADWLGKATFGSGINITYTESPNDLNEEYLEKFDGVVIYANHDYMTSSQEAALKDFVEGGKGLIPIHSASGNFMNSDWYVSTIGGQFESHGEGTFAADIVKPDHPVMQGVGEIETWDETYVHKRINPDMEVLMERVDGNYREPYTWVREQGEGRVFYTAYGHDDRTWMNYDYLQLLKNGILWAIGDEVQGQIAALNVPNVSIYDTMNISDYTQRYIVPEIQPALTPEESTKLIQVPVGFRVELFAAEPDVINPISMAWDERGRLWVLESVDYPNTFAETDGESNDRIKILEDTDGDGKADKFTIFADSLNIPTSLAFANGGVIVAMAPDIIFLKDTDGDDKADVREVLMTGWGKADTHSGPSNLLYGFDNKIWGVTGYSGFNGTINGERWNFNQGVYNLNPDGSEFEYLAGTSNNTWGLGITEDNNIFISTANNTHSAFYSMPAKLLQRHFPGPGKGAVGPRFNIDPVHKIDGHYEAHHVTPNSRQVDVVGGFTSATGHSFYTARDYPKEYWNRVAFISEPTVRLVHKAIIEPDGAGFKEFDGWNMMASTDEWFGSVEAKVGPDGAVWIADWYNFIIQHNVFVERQAPSRVILPFEDQPHGQGNAFESELRDTNHGRIYRIVYENSETKEPISLSKDDTKGLVTALENDNMFWRMTAQRLLVEKKDLSVVPSLFAIVNNRTVDEIGLNSPAIHALWTLHGLGVLDGSNEEAIRTATRALTHPAAGVRKAAAQVLPKNENTVEALVNSGIFNDKDLNTRMNALLVAESLPSSEKLGRVLYRASSFSDNAQDDWISKALFAASVVHKDGFLAAAAEKATSADGSLTNRLVESLSKETYYLPRRGHLQFPTEVIGKELEVNVSVRKRGNEEMRGVLIAHGDSDNGYALYFEEDLLHWVIIQDGQQYEAVSSKELSDSFDVVALLDRGGQMSLVVDGETVGKAKAPSLFTEGVKGTVRSGEDAHDDRRVGDYEGSFRFEGGSIQDISLSLQ